MQPTQKRVKELLTYSPKTGIFIWRVPSNRWGRTPAGAVAGTVRPDGRRHIYIDGKNYLASRVAVLWMTGTWPLRMVDHVDGNKGNDRWKNLRQADKSKNGANSKKPVTNTSGHKGVHIYRGNKGIRWCARLKLHGKTVWLGAHSTLEAAKSAYLAGAKKHFGEFARAG